MSLRGQPSLRREARSGPSEVRWKWTVLSMTGERRMEMSMSPCVVVHVLHVNYTMGFLGLAD